MNRQEFTFIRGMEIRTTDKIYQQPAYTLHKDVNRYSRGRINKLLHPLRVRKAIRNFIIVTLIILTLLTLSIILSVWLGHTTGSSGITLITAIALGAITNHIKHELMDNHFPCSPHAFDLIVKSKGRKYYGFSRLK